jgi:hypothetical protein
MAEAEWLRGICPSLEAVADITENAQGRSCCERAAGE